MGTDRFRVAQIDHVELFVPDRYKAARWYDDVLGLEILTEYEGWAVDGGPLMISSDGGSTKLALFVGEPRGSREPVGHYLVAFRTDGAGFLAFLDRLESLQLQNHRGELVTHGMAVDHDQAFSIYFNDPSGNRCEVTTYHDDYVRDGLSTD